MYHSKFVDHRVKVLGHPFIVARDAMGWPDEVTRDARLYVPNFTASIERTIRPADEGGSRTKFRIGFGRNAGRLIIKFYTG